MTTTQSDLDRPELAKLALLAAFGVLGVASEAYLLGRRAGHKRGMAEAIDDEAIIRRAAERGADVARLEEAAQERIRAAEPAAGQDPPPKRADLPTAAEVAHADANFHPKKG